MPHPFNQALLITLAVSRYSFQIKFYKELPLSDSHIVKGRKMGVSIISKYPFVQSEIFMLENPHITKTSETGVVYTSHEKGFLITRIQTRAGEICCVTGHQTGFYICSLLIAKYIIITSPIRTSWNIN